MDLLNVTIASVSLGESHSEPATLSRLGALFIIQQASGCRAQAPCTSQPSLVVVNDQGYLASNIGTPENPWFVTVHVEGNLTSLRGNRASVIGGYVVFSELTVLAVASNISLVYEIEKPANLNEYERKIK